MQGSDSNTSKVKTPVDPGVDPLALIAAPDERDEWSLDDDHTWFFPPEAEPVPATPSVDEASGVPIAERVTARPMIPTHAPEPPARPPRKRSESPPPTPKALPPFARLEPNRAGPRLVVEVLSLDALLDIERQILGRGLLLPLDQVVAVGVDLDVCVIFPNVGHELWFFGRVVYASAAGVAIDIQPTAYDKARWLDAATAFRSRTPFVQTPGASPRSQPPRLRTSSQRAPASPTTDVARPGTGVRPRRQLDCVSMDERQEIVEADAHPPSPAVPSTRPARKKRLGILRAKASAAPPLTGSGTAGDAEDAPPSASVRSPSGVHPTSADRPSSATHQRPPSGAHEPPRSWAQRPSTGVSAPRTGAVPTGARPRRPEPARPKPAAPPPGFYGARFTQQLEVREVRIAAHNRFALLGLHWSAYPERIRESYEREKALFDPANVPNDLLAKHGSRIHAILLALDSAWESLRDRASRRAHRAAIVSDDALKNAIAHYLDQGRSAVLRDDREHALDCLERVADMDPKDEEAERLLGPLRAQP